MNSNIFITIIGLLLTGYGALVSVYGALKTKNYQLFYQVCTLCGYNGDDFKSLLVQKYYSIFGFAFILIGTIVQIIGNIDRNQILIENSYIVFTLLLLILLVITITIKNVVEKKCKNELEKMKEYYKEFKERSNKNK